MESQKVESNLKFIWYAVLAYCIYQSIRMINCLVGTVDAFLAKPTLFMTGISEFFLAIFYGLIITTFLLSYILLKKKDDKFGMLFQSFICGSGLAYLVYMILRIVDIKSIGIGIFCSILGTIIYLTGLLIFVTLFIKKSSMLKAYFNNNTGYKDKLFINLKFLDKNNNNQLNQQNMNNNRQQNYQPNNITNNQTYQQTNNNQQTVNANQNFNQYQQPAQNVSLQNIPPQQPNIPSQNIPVQPNIPQQNMSVSQGIPQNYSGQQNQTYQEQNQNFGTNNFNNAYNQNQGS